MTIGDCSCYWDIKQTYFVWSLSAQILYFFYLSQAFAKKETRICLHIHWSTLAHFLNLGTLHIEL